LWCSQHNVYRQNLNPKIAHYRQPSGLLAGFQSRAEIRPHLSENKQLGPPVPLDFIFRHAIVNSGRPSAVFAAACQAHKPIHEAKKSAPMLRDATSPNTTVPEPSAPRQSLCYQYIGLCLFPTRTGCGRAQGATKCYGMLRATAFSPPCHTAAVPQRTLSPTPPAAITQ
jgi:hypothetical protein